MLIHCTEARMDERYRLLPEVNGTPHRSPLEVGWQWWNTLNSVTRGAYRRLGIMDTSILAGTYCTTQPIAEALNWLQWSEFLLRYGRMVSPWMPEAGVKPVGIAYLGPGYTCKPRQVVWVAEILHHAGYVVVFMKTPPEGNILGYSETIEINRDRLQMVCELRRRYEVPVTFMGMSYGGCCMVRMARLVHEQGGLVVNRLVPAQSPIQGSRIARFGDYPATREMMTMEDWGDLGMPGENPIVETMRCIEYLEGIGTQCRYLHAQWDEVVQIKHTRPPADGPNTFRWSYPLPHWGHAGVCQNPFARVRLADHILDRYKPSAKW